MQTGKTMKERIYWHDTTQMPAADPLTPLPEKVDVAIIGSGFTGLSAARTLTQRGASVAVLEAETIGWGASSRNGGMSLTGLKLSLHTIIKRYGRELAHTLFQCSLDSIAAVEQIVREENISCGFARTGHLVVASKPQHYDGLVSDVEFMQKEFNHTVRIVPKSELHSEIGSDVYFGGLVDEASGGLNPAQYVTGLAHAALKAGANLCAKARLLRVERNNGQFTLETARGKIRADKVLVATSGYIDSALPQFKRRIIPIGSFIIATEPLAPELARNVSPRNRMIFDSKHFLNYFRLSADNSMIFGGRAAFFPESTDTIRRSAAILQREMLQVYPQLKDVRVEYAWGGTLDFTFDTMTHVGEENGIYYSLGYAGHGVAMGTYLGKTVAESMLAGTIKQHPFAAYGFNGMSLYNGNPWLVLPLAGLWYRFLDLVE
jgi:glycine/D-amino acid oxidase-like deaminating enzyme